MPSQHHYAPNFKLETMQKITSLPIETLQIYTRIFKYTRVWNIKSTSILSSFIEKLVNIRLWTHMKGINKCLIRFPHNVNVGICFLGPNDIYWANLLTLHLGLLSF
jgi:hypothetical protein